MSNKGRSNAAKKRRHAKAMAKRKAEKEYRKREYQANIILGANSKRKQIAKRKGVGRIVKDFKNPSLTPYVAPSRYAEVFW